MDGYGGLLLLAALLVLWWLVFARTRRQQRREAQVRTEVQDGLAAGSRVMTTSGLFGVIVSADDPRTVVLEVAPGVPTTWDRRAIAELVDPTAEQTIDVTIGEQTGEKTGNDSVTVEETVNTAREKPSD